MLFVPDVTIQILPQYDFSVSQTLHESSYWLHRQRDILQ